MGARSSTRSTDRGVVPQHLGSAAYPHGDRQAQPVTAQWSSLAPRVTVKSRPYVYGLSRPSLRPAV